MTDTPAGTTQTRAPGALQTPGAAAAPIINRVDPDAPTHRERLLEAMADAIREHGFRGSTVADVVRRARTSRRTFYEHFADREACFLELFDAMNEVLSSRISAAMDPASPWEAQVDGTVGVYIDEVCAEPKLTLACTRELPGLGEAGAARQRVETERFADLLIALAASVTDLRPNLTPMSKTTAVLITGGLRELVGFGVEHGTSRDEMKAAASGVIKAALAPTGRA